MKRFLAWLAVILGFVVFVKFSLLSHAGTCQKLELEGKAKLLEFAGCESDADCTYVRLSCPFDCVTPVHRASVDSALSVVSQYNKSCMMVCPECPPTESKMIRCQAGRCLAS